MFRLFKFIFKRWPEVLIITICVITQCELQMLLPEYMSKIQVLISQSSMPGAVIDNITGQIWTNGGIMIAIAFGVACCACLTCFMAARLSAMVGKDLREATFKKVNSISLSEYSKFDTSTLITRTTNDVENIKGFLLMAIRIMVMSPTMMIIGLRKTIQANASLGLVSAISVPLILVAMGIIFMFASPLFKLIQAKLDKVTVVLRENLTGIRVIRAYNQQPAEQAKFKVANADMTKTIVKVGRVMSFADPAIAIIFDATYLAVFSVGFFSIANAGYPASMPQDIANIMAVAQYTSQIMMSFLMFAMVFVMFPQASASAKRINEILDIKEELNDDEAYTIEKLDELTNGVHGKLEFKDVSFAYPGANEPCVSHISFVANKGKTTAIIGSTGCGKSTIVNLIPRFYDVTEGEILLDDVNIKNYSQVSLRDKLGFVPQTAVLFSGTIKDNMKFGKADATDEEIIKALDTAQATHFISKSAEGINTFVSQSGKNFSGGQKQRLAIARSLIRKPEIYVFDDSFSALDFQTDVKLRTALKPVTKESATIIVAQRVSTIINADEIIVLDEGKIVGQGKHKDLLLNCKVYQDIVASQLDKEEVEKTIRMSKANYVAEGGNN
ncbi:MAG: ABC transporter ATP-binding protein [Bacilli bacterium]